MVRHERRSVTIALATIIVLLGVLSLINRNSGSDSSAQAAAVEGTPEAEGGGAVGDPALTASTVVDPAASTTAAVPVDAATTTDQPIVDEEATPTTGCTLAVRSLRQGGTGDDVICLQKALIANGYLRGSPSGTFDTSTYDAVHELQTDKNMYVDGIVGRETSLALGIWPDEDALVVRTPPPAAGAVDLMGYPLSSVASAGADAPPLPADSGSGRRIVYDRAGQRVWAVSADGEVIRSYLVTGSKYNNELPGTHKVYSKSDRSTAWNGKAWLPLMVRWLDTERGAIGFHAIPLHVEDNSPYQTEAELGQRLSGGCQRQANPDARFLWDFAEIGTPVVVT
jgi:Putative peptidoglycan binding domain/L,D-transpeptidase catalytic domain